MKTYMINLEHARYEVEHVLDALTQVWVDYDESILQSGYISTTHSIHFNTPLEAMEWVLKNEARMKLMLIIDSFSENMEHYTYYGTNIGIHGTSFENLASKLIAEYGICQ